MLSDGDDFHIYHCEDCMWRLRHVGDTIPSPARSLAGSPPNGKRINPGLHHHRYRQTPI
jgi:hypothetical protein